MATLDIGMKDLEPLLENNDIIIIDFWADWCGPCKMFGPVYEKMSEEYPDIKFAKCDTQNEEQLASVFGVQSIPTLAIFREKILIFKEAGALPEAALKDIIEKVITLDMEDVKKKIAEEPEEQEKK